MDKSAVPLLLNGKPLGRLGMTAIDLALAYFRETLLALQVEGQSHDRKLGMPPRYFIVERLAPSPRRRGAPNTREPVQRWRVDLDGVTCIALDDILPHPESGAAGMYFDYAHGDFSIHDDGRTVRIGWLVGPRYGLGLEFRVECDEIGRPHFGKPRIRWES